MIYTVTLNPTIDRTLRYERLVLGAVNRATSARTDLSGKGVNVSVALRQMGVPSVLLGLAAGVSGRTLVEGLSAAGFACDFVHLEGGETRSNITVIDQATGVTTKLNEAGPTVSAEHLDALAARLRQRLAPGDVCVFSGSLPPGAPADCYAQLIDVTHAQGALAALDSSDAPMRAGCRARPDWIKPNRLEAAELLGCPEALLDTPQALAEAIVGLMALGPTHVLLTMGAQGAIYAEAGPAGVPEVWWATPPGIDEVSNVGSGDAALAGALYAAIQGAPARDVARWAVAAGTAAAQEEGTGMPSLARIQALYAQVHVNHL